MTTALRDSPTSLHVSLGHNSSACFAYDGAVIRGYEQERIDRRKSSSAYPARAIDLALDGGIADAAYVTHWFDHFVPSGNKYLDPQHLKDSARRIVWPSHDMTHHDAHARAAAAFAHDNGVAEPATVIVMDGFGNLRECFSAYSLDWNPRVTTLPRLLHRSYGYSASMGLMYQHATEYLDMKAHQDEYKLLGYESKILEVVPLERVMFILETLSKEADDHAGMMMMSTDPPRPTDDLISRSALQLAKSTNVARFERWDGWFSESITFEKRAIAIAFCAQAFLEMVTTRLVRHVVPAGCRRIVLTGGCFYNVKLNRLVQLSTGCRVFSHPLAGDQGAALGMGRPPSMVSRRLGIGQREIPGGWSSDTVRYVDESEWSTIAADAIASDRIVNVVRDGMEYGPRALCNTSTLALPTSRNVSLINSMNDRSTVMPMAPVMTTDAANRFLAHDELTAVSPCLPFMITTVGWGVDVPERLRGVCLNDPMQSAYPGPSMWTSRPQVVDESEDPSLARLLRSTPDGTLINTSFNRHGEPIVFTAEDALRTHRLQGEAAGRMGVDPPIMLLVRS